MRSLRLFFHSRPLSYSIPGTPIDLRQQDNSVLLDMIIDPKTNREIKPFIYKESYYRIPTMSSADKLQLFRLFVDSGVPKEICINIAKAIVLRVDLLTHEEKMELLNIIIYSCRKLISYGSLLRSILESIDHKVISTDFLLNMWTRTTDRFSSANPHTLVYQLQTITVSKLDDLTNPQLLTILAHLRNVKVSKREEIDAIHSNIMTRRRDRHDLMAALLLYLMNSLRFNRVIIESYLEVINEALEKGNITPATITLASVFAKQNFIYPKLYEDLEPYVINFYLENSLTKVDAFNYLHASVIADYFPKKFIQLYCTADKIASVIKDVIATPFLRSGVEVCSVIDYARVKGVDLGLSEEVLKLVEKLAYYFCKKASEFHCNELNPWENRTKALIGKDFPLYGSWPTKAGYFVDCCLFFDDSGKPLSLGPAASVLSQKSKQIGTFDRSGLEIKPSPSMVNFDLIWNLVDEKYTLKDIPHKFVIEFNGPYHFLRPTHEVEAIIDHYRVEGATMLRRKYLQASGWDYIGMPFFQYERRAISSSLGSYIRRLVDHMIATKRTF